MKPDVASRRAVAHRLQAGRDGLAASIADRILQRHAEWADRHGELARERGRQNVEAQIDYLAGALVAGTGQAFEHYVRWAESVLSARGVPRSLLGDNLAELRTGTIRYLEEQSDRAGAEDAHLVDRMIRSGMAALEAEPNGGPDTRGDGEDVGFQVERSFYLEAAMSGARESALEVALDALHSGATVEGVYREMLEPVQYEIGRLWERNEITVAREHTATTVTEYVMSRLHAHLDTPRSWRGRAMVTTAPGEDHEVGARMVAHVLEADGWGIRLLDPHLDHDAILDAVREHRPVLVGVSATVLFNLPAAADLVDGIRNALDPVPAIVLGGPAFGLNPELWRELGADGYGRDLREGLTLARELAATP